MLLLSRREVENMNENKRLLVVGAAILIFIGVILLIAFWPEDDPTFACGVRAEGDYTKIGKVNYKQYECLTEKKGKIVLAVANNMTKKKKDTLEDVAKSNSIGIYYLDVKNMSSKDLKQVKKELKYADNSFKEDVILVVSKGKVKEYKEDVLNKEDDLKSFLKEAKIAKFACGVSPNEEYGNLGAATYEDYNCLYESGEPFAIILSQTTCGYCQKYKPFINEYVGKANIPLYVIEVNTLGEEERSALLSSLSYFDDNESWGTPLTLGIKDKKVVEEISGFTDDESQVDEFFEKMDLK